MRTTDETHLWKADGSREREFVTDEPRTDPPTWELSIGATDDESGAQVAIALVWPKGSRRAVMTLLARQVMAAIVRVNDLTAREGR